MTFFPKQYEIALKYAKNYEDQKFFQDLKTNFDSLNLENQELRLQSTQYLKEISQLSHKLVEADGIVKQEILIKDKIKQQLSEIRIENSNLVLINRNLRQKLLSLGLKVDENEKIIKKLNSIESFKEKIDLDINPTTNSYAKNHLEQKKHQEISIQAVDLKDNTFSCNVKAPRKLKFKVQSQISIIPSKKFSGKKKGNNKIVKKDLISTKKHNLEIKTDKSLTVFNSTPKLPQFKLTRLRKTTEFSLIIKAKKVISNILSIKTISIQSIKPIQPKLSTIATQTVNNPSSVNLSLSMHRIFATEKGRCQVDQPTISDDEETTMLSYQKLFKPKLEVSRTQIIKIPSLKRLFSVRRQAGVKITPKEKHLKIELIISTEIVPKMQSYASCTYSVNSLSQAKNKLVQYQIFNKSQALDYEECESFSVLQQIELLDSLDDGARKGKRQRGTPKRTNAIEEYFILV
jgi:hypothetical protein